MKMDKILSVNEASMVEVIEVIVEYAFAGSTGGTGEEIWG